MTMIGVARPDPIRTGLVLALASAATFGSAGATAKSLLIAGWSTGGAVLVRLTGSALILVLITAIVHRGRWPLRPGDARTLVVYGVVAMAGTQFAYFNAVRRLDVGVALLLEFTAPVMMLAWSSFRTRTLPKGPTLLGAAVAVAGMVVVIDPRGAGALDPVGVAWGLVAAACMSGFFLLSASGARDIPVLVLAAGGTTVGAVAMALLGAVGVVPLAFSSAPTLLAGRAVPWFVPAGSLVIIGTVVAYLTGVGAIARLGTRVSSFVALTEVLFAVLFAWLLLAELPGWMQLAGGILIVTGVVLVEQTERRTVAPPGVPVAG